MSNSAFTVAGIQSGGSGGGTGTVTSLTATNGVKTVSGSAITTTGTFETDPGYSPSWIGTTITSGGSLVWNNSSNTYSVGFQAGSLSATTLWTLPATDGSNGQAIVTNGSNVLSFASIAAGSGLQSFTILTSGSGTYTPGAGVAAILVECLGAGGGSGGVASTSSSQWAGSAGGSGGGYCRKWIPSGSLLSSYAYVVGAAGTAGTSGNNQGGNGANTTFGSAFLTAGGGAGGGGGPAQVFTQTVGGQATGSGGGIASGGDINFTGQTGGPAFYPGMAIGGYGGGSFYGNATIPVYSQFFPHGGTGNTGLTNQGTGGTGSFNLGSQSAVGGVAGGSGIIIIWEFS